MNRTVIIFFSLLCFLSGNAYGLKNLPHPDNFSLMKKAGGVAITGVVIAIACATRAAVLRKALAPFLVQRDEMVKKEKAAGSPKSPELVALEALISAKQKSIRNCYIGAAVFGGLPFLAALLYGSYSVYRARKILKDIAGVVKNKGGLQAHQIVQNELMGMDKPQYAGYYQDPQSNPYRAHLDYLSRGGRYLKEAKGVKVGQNVFDSAEATAYLRELMAP